MYKLIFISFLLAPSICPAQTVTYSNLVGTWKGLIGKDTVFFKVFKNRNIIAGTRERKNRYCYELKTYDGQQHIFINAIYPNNPIDSGRNIALDQLIRMKNDSVILIKDGDKTWQIETDSTTKVFIKQKPVKKSTTNVLIPYKLDSFLKVV